jgi:hypothetical protein
MTQRVTRAPVTVLEDVVHSPVGRGMTFVVTVLVTIMVGAGAWLFAPSSTGIAQPPPNLEQYDYLDGVLVEVDLPQLIMNSYEPVDGESRITFRVPDASLQYFDVVHLRAHSSIGLPTRIYYDDLDGELIAVFKTDAPLNSSVGVE